MIKGGLKKNDKKLSMLTLSRKVNSIAVDTTLIPSLITTKLAANGTNKVVVLIIAELVDMRESLYVAH